MRWTIKRIELIKMKCNYLFDTYFIFIFNLKISSTFVNFNNFHKKIISLVLLISNFIWLKLRQMEIKQNCFKSSFNIFKNIFVQNHVNLSLINRLKIQTVSTKIKRMEHHGQIRYLYFIFQVLFPLNIGNK